MQLQLSDIPWRKFKRWLTKRDISVFEGSDEPAEQVAERLHLAYLDAKATQRTINTISIENNIIFNWYKVSITQELVDALNEQYHEKLAGLLRKMYNLPLTPESYKEDLVRVVSKAKKYKIEYDRFIAEKEKPTHGGSAPDDAYYASLENAISKMVGYFIPDDIDTQRMADLERNLTNELDKTKTDG